MIGILSGSKKNRQKINLFVYNLIFETKRLARSLFFINRRNNTSSRSLIIFSLNSIVSMNNETREVERGCRRRSELFRALRSNARQMSEKLACE